MILLTDRGAMNASAATVRISSAARSERLKKLFRKLIQTRSLRCKYETSQFLELILP